MKNLGIQRRKIRNGAQKEYEERNGGGVSPCNEGTRDRLCQTASATAPAGISAVHEATSVEAIIPCGRDD